MKLGSCWLWPCQGTISQANSSLCHRQARRRGAIPSASSLQAEGAALQSHSTHLGPPKTFLGTKDNLLPPIDSLGPPQPAVVTALYLTGPCGGSESSRPGQRRRAGSAAAGTCSCRWAGSGCAPQTASSHSASPCLGTASTCRPWSGDQPTGREAVRKGGAVGSGRGEVPRNASDSHCNQYGTMGMHIVSMHGWHKWIYQEAKPLGWYCRETVTRNGPQKQRKQHCGNKPWLFRGYVKKASCLKASGSHMLCKTLILCNNDKAFSMFPPLQVRLLQSFPF